MSELLQHITKAMSFFPDWVVVGTVSALPVFELRGGLPLAIGWFKMSFVEGYIISVLGNMLPVPFILFLLGPVSKWAKKIHWLDRFLSWIFERTKKRSAIIEKYEAIGLTLFVAIPFVMTGAWTGCIAAWLLKIRFRYAIISIFAGILIAGIIVSLATKFGLWGYEILAVPAK